MHDQLKILILEDLEDDVGLIERALNREKISFIYKRVDTQAEFLDALENFHPDVILSDHALPQFNSIDALKICRERNLTMPFLLVTGTVSEEFAVNCLKQGVDDYILKSNLSRLPNAIRNALKQREAESKKKEAELSLRQQNEELIKINQELDSFVYSVSHNIRGPLASVLGLINLAKIENRNVSLPYADLIEKRVHQLDKTLKKILDYSRNARTKIITEKIEFRKFILDVFEQLNYLSGKDKIKLNIEVEGHTHILADPYRLNIILQNLLSNSIKYCDWTKSRQEVSIHAKLYDDQWNSILCQDNGIGIKTELIPRVFEMFFRATETDGQGLGLYIAKETVEKMGGKISIESQLGTGTTVHIRLPKQSVNHEEIIS